MPSSSGKPRGNQELLQHQSSCSKEQSPTVKKRREKSQKASSSPSNHVFLHQKSVSWRFLLTAGGLSFSSRCHEACQRWLAFGSAAGVDWPGEFRKRERSGETWRRREEEKASPRAARPVQLHLYPSRDGELSGWSGPDEQDQRGSAGLSTGGRRMVLSEASASGDGHGKQHAVAAEGENETLASLRPLLPQTWQYFSRGVIQVIMGMVVITSCTQFLKPQVQHADYKIMAEAISIHHD